MSIKRQFSIGSLLVATLIISLWLALFVSFRFNAMKLIGCVFLAIYVCFSKRYSCLFWLAPVYCLSMIVLKSIKFEVQQLRFFPIPLFHLVIIPISIWAYSGNRTLRSYRQKLNRTNVTLVAFANSIVGGFWIGVCMAFTEFAYEYPLQSHQSFDVSYYLVAGPFVGAFLGVPSAVIAEIIVALNSD